MLMLINLQVQTIITKNIVFIINSSTSSFTSVLPSVKGFKLAYFEYLIGVNEARPQKNVTTGDTLLWLELISLHWKWYCFVVVDNQ